MSFTWAYRDGVWFASIRFALLLAVVLCWSDRCLGSPVLLGLFCYPHATHGQHPVYIAPAGGLDGVHAVHACAGPSGCVNG